MFLNIILPYIEPNCWVPNVFSLHANLKKSMMILKKSLVHNESNESGRSFFAFWNVQFRRPSALILWDRPFDVGSFNIGPSTFIREYPLLTWLSKVTPSVTLVLETAWFSTPYPNIWKELTKSCKRTYCMTLHNQINKN